jgi:hypothetical protein
MPSTQTEGNMIMMKWIDYNELQEEIQESGGKHSSMDLTHMAD